MEQGNGGFEPLPYHTLTKHTPASVRASHRRVDWMDQPEPFKNYLHLNPLALPEPAADTGFPAPQAATGALGTARNLDLAELTRLLVLAAGVLRVRAQPNGKRAYLRSYACAGALYPIEVYLAAAAIPSLEPGVYHYSPLEDALRLLRPGDPRPHLLRAAAGRPGVVEAPATMILTGIGWRTNFKYGARGYRHLFWDAGMILANLLALCASGGHRSEVVLGFVDHEIDTLLGIDGRSEMSLCLVPVGTGATAAGTLPASGPAAPIDHAVGRLSFNQREYDEVASGHRQTALHHPAEVQLWQQDYLPAAPPRPAPMCPQGIERTIRRRGSKRTFQRLPIDRDDLEGVIAHATYDLACDWGPGLTQVGLIANAVKGLAPGSYAAVYGLEQLAFGNLRDRARFLCLEQDLGGDAAATLFLLTDLEDADRSLGTRGYRAAQLNAGIVGGRLYLCAYACGFGATGLTFYDDEVRSFFRTDAEPMLAIALGH